MRRLVVLLLLGAIGLVVAQLLRGSSDDAPGGAADSPHGTEARSLPSFAREGSDARTDVPPPATAAPAPLIDGSALELTVLHADGAPAAGCLVVVLPSEGASWHSNTTEAGLARGPGLASDGEAWVAGATLQPQRFALSVRRGAVTLTLPAGEVVEGRALVDGAPPSEPFALALIPLGDAPDPSRTVSKLLDRPELGPFDMREPCGQLVRGEGRFRFSGLPAGWSGSFLLPAGLTAEDQETLAATASESGRVLHLRRVPRLRLRVLSPSGEPAAKASVELNLKGQDGSNTNSLTTDDDGRASCALGGLSGPLSAVIDIADASRSARLHLTPALPDPLQDVDLGELRLEPAWTVLFRALDPRGSPIAGAVGGTECVELVQSAPTGDDGIGRVAGVPVGCAELCVAAARCETVRVPLPAPPPATPIDVVLAPCACLDVHVVADDGQPRPGLTLYARMLMVDAHLHEVGFEYVAQMLSRSDSPRQSMRSSQAADGTRTLDRGFDFPVPESGVVHVGCLRPGDPVDLKLLDVTSHVLASREGLTLQPHEQAVVTLAANESAGALDVMVTDAAGQPLEGAAVKLAAAAEKSDLIAPGRTVAQSTDAAGHVRLESIYAPAVDVDCSHSGFAPVHLAAVPVGGELHVVLGEGLTVTVHFIDDQGQPAPVPVAWIARQDGVSLQQSHQGRSAGSIDDELRADWVFTQLPDVPLVIMTNITGRRLQWPHDPHDREARCVVPAIGRLVVSGLENLNDEELRVFVRSASVETEAMYGWLNEETEATGRLSWPVVLAGRYEVSLLRVDDDQKTIVRGPVSVEVRPGAEAVAELH